MTIIMFTAQVTSSWDSTVDSEDKLRYRTSRNRSSIPQRGKAYRAGPQVHTASHYNMNAGRSLLGGKAAVALSYPFTSTSCRS